MIRSRGRRLAAGTAVLLAARLAWGAFPDRTSAFEAVFLDAGREAVPGPFTEERVIEALRTLDLSRRQLVYSAFLGDTDFLARAGEEGNRARAVLDAAAREPALLLDLSPTTLTRWLAAAHRERRLEWSRALLDGMPNRLPAPETPDRTPLAFAVAMNARDLETAVRDGGDIAGARFAAQLAEDALTLCILEPSPYRGEALHQLIALAEARGDSARASVWADSLAQTPGARVPWSRLPRARRFLREGRSEDAVVEARRALPAADSPAVRRFLVEALLANDRPMEAAAVLEDLLARYPNDPGAAEALAIRLRLGDERSELALDARSRLRLLEPLLVRAESQGLVAALAESAALAPEVRDEARLVLGRFRYRTKQYPEAEALLERIIESADTAVAQEARLYLARAYRNTGKADPMERHYRALSGGGRAAEAVWELAREMESLGHWKQAEAGYGVYVDRFANSSRHGEAHFRRGVVRIRRNHREDAVRDFRAALGEARTDTDTERSAYWLARTLRDLGRDTEAKEAARAAASRAEPADYYGLLAREQFDLWSSDAPVPAAGDIPWRPDIPLDALPDSSGLPAVAAEAFRRGVALAEMGEIAGAKLEWQAVLAAGDAALFPLALTAAVYTVYPEGVWWAERAASRLAAAHPWNPGLRRLAMPPAYYAEVTQYAAAYALDPALVWAVMRQESLYDPLAVSRAGALGLLQLMPVTLSDLAAEAQVTAPPAQILFHARTNVALGTRFLSQRLQGYAGRELPALASYNAGENKVAEWMDLSDDEDEELFVESIGYPETYGYVRRVPWLSWLYRRYYGPRQLADDGR